jgi:hypothetical protein
MYKKTVSDPSPHDRFRLGIEFRDRACSASSRKKIEEEKEKEEGRMAGEAEGERERESARVCMIE